MVAIGEGYPFFTGQADVFEYLIKRMSPQPLPLSEVDGLARGGRQLEFMLFGTRILSAVVKSVVGLYLCRKGTMLLNFLCPRGATEIS